MVAYILFFLTCALEKEKLFRTYPPFYVEDYMIHEAVV